MASQPLKLAVLAGQAESAGWILLADWAGWWLLPADWADFREFSFGVRALFWAWRRICHKWCTYKALTLDVRNFDESEKCQ